MRNYRVSNRRYRNRRIGDFLKELHLTEGRNTGFKKILSKNPTMTQAKIMQELDLTRKQVQKDIKALQDKGLLEREGSNRNGRWIVKD